MKKYTHLALFLALPLTLLCLGHAITRAQSPEPTPTLTVAEIAVRAANLRPVPPEDAFARLGPDELRAVRARRALSATAAISITGAPTYYIVAEGDTVGQIAAAFGVPTEIITHANTLGDGNLLDVGQLLVIPNAAGELPAPALHPALGPSATLTITQRGTITERMTLNAQQVISTSPFYSKTWLSYYGRPGVPIMGILGEYSIEELTPLLRQEGRAYDRANGGALKVQPAFHLVYGMATKAPGDDGSHLGFLTDEVVMEYIEAAEKEHFTVILDVQIGALSPADAITPALPYLSYPFVHLAIDPEFAMSHPGQAWPGDPIGYVTAEQVNEVQGVIERYLRKERLPGPRVLLVHQFQDTMIEDPENLDAGYRNVALTLSVDGWGDPWGKITKYNSFISPQTSFSAFKLFYGWDEPLLTPEQALGEQYYGDTELIIDVTPNLIIYQ